MSLKTLTLHNDWHNTSVTLRLGYMTGVGYYANKRQVARARAILCPVPTCKCGGNMGERGVQGLAQGLAYAIYPISDKIMVVELMVVEF